MRRSPSSPEGGPRGFTAADLEIDFDTRRVRANGKDVRLTPKEFELLRYLVAHTGRPVTHRELLQAVWGPDYGDEPEYLRVFINQLRKKIEANPGEAQVHPDRALGRLPLRRMVLVFSALLSPETHPKHGSSDCLGGAVPPANPSKARSSLRFPLCVLCVSASLR